MTHSPFALALGAAFDDLPPALRSFHDGDLPKLYRGQANVICGQHPLARLASRMAGFPPAGEDTVLSVRVEATLGGEVWTRDFGGHPTRSILRFGGPNAVDETFGFITMRLILQIRDDALDLSVGGVWLFGRIPLPRWLWPISRSHESQTTQGAFAFDIATELPGIGPLIRYHGSLTPQ